MRKPLNNWDTIPRAYEQGDRTFYGAKHRGVDYMVKDENVYAPADGRVILAKRFKVGGKTLWYKFEEKGRIYIMRCLHLDELPPIFNFNEGDLIGVTGNTGMSTAPHLHLDLSKDEFKLMDFSNFVDPDKFFRDNDMMKLIKEDNNIFAIGNDNKKHLIFNEETFNEGKLLGLWDGNIDQDEVEVYDEGHSIILISND